MTLTRSQTKSQREAPGLHLLADAILIVERLEEVKKLKKGINDNVSKDMIENYIIALEKVVEDFDIPSPPAPKVGHTQYYDHNEKKWVFCKV